jgi:hypothetical protein
MGEFIEPKVEKAVRQYGEEQMGGYAFEKTI